MAGQRWKFAQASGTCVKARVEQDKSNGKKKDNTASIVDRA